MCIKLLNLPFNKLCLAIEIHLNLTFMLIIVCFVSFDALLPSQQQWSCQEVASMLWDFYPTLGCHDTQNVLHKYNHPTKPVRHMLIMIRKTNLI